MVFLNLAVISFNFTSVIHDSKMQRYLKHNSPHRRLLRFLPFLLHPALVSINQCRIYKWNQLIMISFVAGIIQTILYADFIYYFIKSNQNEHIINLPIWSVIIIKLINKSLICTSPLRIRLTLLTAFASLFLVSTLAWLWFDQAMILRGLFFFRFCPCSWATRFWMLLADTSFQIVS